MGKIRLAIIATHPIQYYAPVFRLLAEDDDIALRVFYGWRGLVDTGFDPGFGISMSWDIPLLNGYDYEFVTNVSSDPGTHNFNGIECPDLCKRLEEWRPDVIAVYGWSFRAHLQVLRHFHGRVPILFRGDSHLLDKVVLWRNCLRTLWLKYVYRHIDIAVAVGTENVRYYKKCGVKTQNIVHAPHAVDNIRFANEAACNGRMEFRRRLGIPSDGTVLGFSGKLEAKKAPDVLLTAFNRSGRSDLYLVFLGTGELLHELQSSASTQVRFLGFVNQSDIPVAYHSMDVLVLPSRGPGETWGLAVNEAMACGKPVICSSAVGCATDLVTCETGWVFENGDVESLTELLRRLPNRRVLATMGESCQSLIQNWSFEIQVAGWKMAIKRVCK